MSTEDLAHPAHPTFTGLDNRKMAIWTFIGSEPFLMEKILPQNALLHLSIPRSEKVALGYVGSNLKKMLDHPEIRGVIEPVEKYLEFDHRGNVTDYERRGSCTGCAC